MSKRFLIVALGSAGRRHLETVRRVLPDADITVLRRPESIGTVPEGVRGVDTFEAALETAPDAAIIASPAPHHVATATQLVEAGVHLLIEKPLSDRMDGVDRLIATARKTERIIQVGYCLRFDPSLAAVHAAVSNERIGRVLSVRAVVGQYLPNWRPGTDFRQGVSARKDLGGGALLELSHEIDIARWLGGEVETVLAQIGRLGDLDMDAENHADLLFSHAEGVLGAVHLDMLQRTPVRQCTVVGSDGTVVWDGIGHAAGLFRADTGEWEILHDGEGVTTNSIVAAQFRHFLSCIRTQTPPLVDGEDGRRTLTAVLAARRSAEEERKIRISESMMVQ